MLINQEEIISFPLNKRAVDDYTAQVINTLNGIVNPVERYAVARCLKDIFEEACRNCGASAETYCEEENIGSDGKEFELFEVTENPAHKKVWLNRQFDMEYNYAANATDEEGDPVDYTASVQRLARTQRTLKARRAIVNANKELIEAAHPNMVPDVVRIVFKLCSIPD